jgi:PAS domain S-box-containing protein
MTGKPTNEEFEQKIQELEEEAGKRKEAEEELRKYQLMIESAHDAIFFKDLRSRYITANNKTLEAFGLSREDVIGRNDYELMPDKKEAKKNVYDDQIVFKSAKPTEVAKHMTGADGKEYWFQAIKAPQFDNNGKVIGLVGIARDITKRKQIEEALKESEEKYRNLIERANDGVIIVQDGIVKFVNNRMADLFGYNVGEMQNTSFLDYVFPEERNRIKELHERRLKEEDVPDIYEMQVLHKDGRKLDVETNSGIITYHRKPAVLAFIRDITRRKQIEETLRESESRYKSLFNNHHSVMLVIDPKNGDIVDANPAAIFYYGWSHEELTAKKITDINMLTKEQVFQEMEKAKSERRRQFIFRHHLSNGDIRDVEVYSGPIQLHGQQLLYSIIHDITDRKHAEEALKKEKDKAQNYLDISGVIIVVLNMDQTVGLINKKGCEILGYEESEIVGKNWFDNFLPKNNRERTKSVFFELINENIEPIDYNENAVMTKDNEERLIAWHNAALRNNEGKIIATLSSGEDVTNRKRAEEALQKAHYELEHRVKERTKELEIKTNSLVEVNTAMKVLLKKREEDKEELEDNILSNLKGMIEPYFKKINKTKMDDKQKVLLSIIESNLEEIISPFANKLSSKYINLTPAEIHVADFVKHGKRNKEIANLLNLSVRTIESHRESIRKKIGIKNKKTNLRSYLLSFH